jgi:hypothetical protein
MRIMRPSQADIEKRDTNSISKAETDNDKKLMIRADLGMIVSSAVAGLGILIVLSFWLTVGRIPFIVGAAVPLFTLIAIIYQAVVYHRQWHVMQDSVQRTDKIIENMQSQLIAMREQSMMAQVAAEAAKVSAKVAEQQIKFMARTESAYLSVSDLKPVVHKEQLFVVGKIFNRGKTPAFDFQRKIQIAIVEGHPPVGWGRFDWSFNPEECESLEIAAGDSVNFVTGSVDVDSAILAELNGGVLTIVVDGQCRYRDNMGDLLIYKFGLAIELDPPRGHIRYQEHRREEANPN